jgi:hypothetical protein
MEVAMRFVSSVTFASALLLSFATTALADLSDPSADTSIPLRGAQMGGLDPNTTVQPADVQPFTNSTNSIARPEDFQMQPRSAAPLPSTTGGGEPAAPFSAGGKEAASPKPPKSSSSGGLLDVPKKSIELSNDATKGSLDLTEKTAKSSLELSDKAAKDSVGLADKAAKTTLGVPGKILKSLF